MLFLVLSRKVMRALCDDTKEACEGDQRCRAAFCFVLGPFLTFLLSSKIIFPRKKKWGRKKLSFRVFFFPHVMFFIFASLPPCAKFGLLKNKQISGRIMVYSHVTISIISLHNNIRVNSRVQKNKLLHFH